MAQESGRPAVLRSPGEGVSIYSLPGDEPYERSRPARNLIGRLQFLTMDEGPLGHLQQVEMACRAGIRWIQLRMKGAVEDQFLHTALAAKRICDECGCALIINDRVDIAKAVRADGVHLGKQDMPVGEARQLLGNDFIIGGTANTAEDILEHCRQGADYIGLGPYRYTTTKKKLSPVLGLEGYRKIMDILITERVSVPIVAIGGIVMEDLAELLRAGLYGVAFSGLLVNAADPKKAVRELMEKIRAGDGQLL